MLGAGAAAAADAAAALRADAALSAQQIVARYVEARGGAEAWRKVQTMGWTGHIQSGARGATPVPFLMLFKRPNATRFEIIAQRQRSVRIFDGTQGWKQRPGSDGIPEFKEYTAEENAFARDAAGLDGPLIDSRRKGVRVALQGRDQVDGHEAYRLRVTLPSGQVQTAWIDAQTFLELRRDRPTRDALGRQGVVSVYLRDYRPIAGLVMPFTIESGGAAGQSTDKITIEKIALNPTLEAGAFSKPAELLRRRMGVLVDTTAPPVAPTRR